MGLTLTQTMEYNRPALHPSVSTPIDVTLSAVNDALALDFLNGVLTILIQADADERPGSGFKQVASLFRVDLTPVINSDGTVVLNSMITPILGSNADSPTPTPIYVIHDENMDQWQTEEGRARQNYLYTSPEAVDDQLLFTGSVLNSPFFEFSPL